MVRVTRRLVSLGENAVRTVDAWRDSRFGHQKRSHSGRASRACKFWATVRLRRATDWPADLPHLPLLRSTSIFVSKAKQLRLSLVPKSPVSLSGSLVSLLQPCSGRTKNLSRNTLLTSSVFRTPKSGLVVLSLASESLQKASLLFFSKFLVCVFPSLLHPRIFFILLQGIHAQPRCLLGSVERALREGPC